MDDAETHNVHICSDGNFYYTINGGDQEKGLINKYDLSGNWISSFPLKLDMRSIFYNPSDENFYLNAYDNNVYKIKDFTLGQYELVFEELYENNQASLALSTNGKQLFALNEGTLRIYDMMDGTLLSEFKNIMCGEDHLTGSAAVAVSEKYFYTWSSKRKSIYVYNHNGQHMKTIMISHGDYGFSISFANGYLFVSEDGNYNTGRWLGYDLSEIIDLEPIRPFRTFQQIPIEHNLNICSDSKYYYTINGKSIDSNEINKYNLDGKLEKSYKIRLETRTIICKESFKEQYVSVFHEGPGKNLYEITNLQKGEFRFIHSGLYSNSDASIDINNEKSFVYSFDKGVLSHFSFSEGKKVYEINGLKHGPGIEGGEAAIAFGKKHLFTWNAKTKVVYIYDLSGKLLHKVQIAIGDYGPSLSFANNLLFVSSSKDEGLGIWFEYDLTEYIK